MKIGFGYDIHKLVQGRKLYLGGVEIPYVKGLLGHSDADVLLHALCDALLGGAGAGDIGEHFPNTDYTYKDISSIELLKKTKDIIAGKGYYVKNIDATVCCEEPKLSLFKSIMVHNIANAVGIEEKNINIKATTQEGLGSIGRSEAISAQAVVLLEEK
ncbi:MAG: 2-C-methyl-D-erythritol 2,4-cyclodiphosphate synthase [Candidatus Omnitrophota bacterium]